MYTVLWQGNHQIYVGLARTVYMHRIWPYIWWFPCQKHRIYTVYVWFWPTLNILGIYGHVWCAHLVLADPKHMCSCLPSAVPTAHGPPWACCGSARHQAVPGVPTPPGSGECQGGTWCWEHSGYVWPYFELIVGDFSNLFGCAFTRLGVFDANKHGDWCCELRRFCCPLCITCEKRTYSNRGTVCKVEAPCLV